MSTAPMDVTTTAFALPPDAKVVQVSELSPRLRARIGPVEGQQAVVTRPGYRVAARLVPAPLAALLAEFRSPTLLSEAVLRFARGHAQDPLETVELAFDGLANLVEARILVPAGSPDLAAPDPSLAAGQAFAGFEIDTLVRSLEDSEVYRAHGPDGTAAALKIGRGHRPHLDAMLAHEARMLASLDGRDVPRLLATGADDGRTWIAMEWCEGVSIATAAQQARASGDRRRAHSLVARMLAAYGRLHGRGVLHGDVHPGNCLVGDDGRIVLIDFGNARALGGAGGADAARTGIPQFYDPQLARAILAKRVPPAADAMTEQYSIAVLAYLLLTGLHPIEAPGEQRALLRRIVDRAVLPFTARGVAAWPEVESVLRRALAHRPRDRFADVAAFAGAFARATVPRRTAHRVASRNDAFTSAVETVRAVAPVAPVWEQGWFALRAALLLEDSELLASADVLSSDTSDGWATQAVATLVARARSDVRGERHATAGFVAAVAPLKQGSARASALFAATCVLDGARASADTENLARWVRAHVTPRLSGSALCSECRSTEPLAIYLSLALAKAGVVALPPTLPAQLGRLADATAASEDTRTRVVGLEWLWAIAYDLFADPRFLGLALSTPLPAASLPRVLTLLRRYQLTGDARWVTRARRVVSRRNGVGCTPLAAALMFAELSAPERMCPPPFINPFSAEWRPRDRRGSGRWPARLLCPACEQRPDVSNGLVGRDAVGGVQAGLWGRPHH